MSRKHEVIDVFGADPGEVKATGIPRRLAFQGLWPGVFKEEIAKVSFFLMFTRVL